jgi:hypothetical protein
MRRILATVLSVTVLGGFGCATYLDDLNRAERHYQSNQHERALALFRALEADMDSLSPADRARYAYLRGINDYRLSGHKEDTATTTATASASTVDKTYRAHARYWLGIARALERQTPGSLRAEWKTNVDEALRDLNQDVFGVGVFPDEPQDPNAAPAKTTEGETKDTDEPKELDTSSDS